MMDERDRSDSKHRTDRAEPTESTDPNEPTDPTDNAEPTDPIDRTDFLDPMLNSEFSDHNDQRLDPVIIRFSLVTRLDSQARTGADRRPPRSSPAGSLSEDSRIRVLRRCGGPTMTASAKSRAMVEPVRADETPCATRSAVEVQGQPLQRHRGRP